MARIDSDRRPGDFGLDFDYAIWTPGTTVCMTWVNWDSNYRDVVVFPSEDAQMRYMHRDPQTRVIESLTYCGQGMPVRLDIPFSEANKYNYIYAENNLFGGKRHRFFYFITDVVYVAPNTVEIRVQLDVWQTYFKDVYVNRCYVERGHIGIAAENQWDDYGRKYLTCPEGLDMGAEYVIGRTWYETIAATWYGDGYDSGDYDVVVASTIDLELEYGDVKNPKFQAASGSKAEGLPNGCSLYAMTNGAFETLAQSLAFVPWVAQGIISIMAIPKGVINFDGMTSVTTPSTKGPEDGKEGANITRPGAEVYPLTKGFGEGHLANNKTINLAPGFRDEEIIPERYRHLWKFWTSPYMMYEVTTFSGTPILVKPETIQGKSLDITQWAHIVPPSPRIMYTVNGQNQGLWVADGQNHNSEHFDAMTGITNFPTFALTNNSYLNYMASNAHSLVYQHASAEWSQQKALRGAATSYNQAALSRQQAADTTDLNNQFDSARTQYNADNQLLSSGVHTVAGSLGQALSGNIGGAAASAIMGGFDMGMQYGSTLENQRMINEQRSAITGLGNQYAARIADSNLAMAKFAAQGDYANAIAGINAKTQDAKLIQPTTVGQQGGDAFNLATDDWKIVCRQKCIDSGAVFRIGEFWLRYGYAMNCAVQPPQNLMCMTNFTYWKMQETYLAPSDCPEGFRQSIRGILEKGVTVWRDPNKIGITDYADNKPIAGIRI